MPDPQTNRRWWWHELTGRIFNLDTGSPLLDNHGNTERTCNETPSHNGARCWSNVFTGEFFCEAAGSTHGPLLFDDSPPCPEARDRDGGRTRRRAHFISMLLQEKAPAKIESVFWHTVVVPALMNADSGPADNGPALRRAPARLRFVGDAWRAGIRLPKPFRKTETSNWHPQQCRPP